MTQNQTSNYTEQGGDRSVIGGEQDLISGGALKRQGTEYLGDSLLPVKVKKLDITADFGNTEQDTGWDLPTKCIVLDVFVDVTTADASQTLDVGTNGSGSDDPDGFLDGVSVNDTGVVKGTLASGGQTKGALLRADENGSGILVPEADVSSGGESVTFTGSDTTNTMRGSIYVLYIEL